MRYMNDFDLARACQRYTEERTPRRLALTLVVTALAEQTNRVSDGWAYWPKPCRAADKAISLIESTAYPEYERRQREDITEAEFKAALTPIKSFLTRHAHVYSAAQRSLILGAADLVRS